MIAVIGGSGFIGTRLCEILRESGVDFRIIDKQMSRYFPDQTEICDVRDIEGLIRATRGASTIINLAAEHRDDVTPRSLYDEVNVREMYGAKASSEFPGLCSRAQLPSTVLVIPA